ncbi:MAG: branched-chain amino acid ABC transporter permease [Firmicutes bacterium]|nr:branched-chain amino acid ABC transporter permease [Bacillota bacterium]
MLQTVVTGLAIGGIYALMAVGYSLVFSILNFSNFAHGTVIMLGAYAGYFVLTLAKAPFPVAIVGSIISGAVIAVANEGLAYRPLRIRNAKPLYFMISAMGVSILLENLVYATIGAHFYSYPHVFEMENVVIGEASIGILDLFALVFSTVAILALHLFLQHTRSGIAIRACSYDMTVASIFGAKLDRVIGLVFLLAGGLAALSGVFLGMKYMVYPTMGWITNKAYVAAVIGGLGSLPGAVIGGVLLGLLETFVSTYISSTIRDVFSFSMLVIFLLVLPTGLLGRNVEEKI